jgi:hypothetical protein
MSSPQKIDANRANGHLSNGPVTDAGKQISSQNAVKHGFTGKTLRISAEEKELYDAHVQGFQAGHQPVGAPEVTLCQELADLHWSLNQIFVQQVNTIDLLEQIDAELRAQGATALAISQATLPQARLLCNLGIYEQRKRRAADDVETRLKTMQKERSEKQAKELREAEKAAPSNAPSSEVGFVCTPEAQTIAASFLANAQQPLPLPTRGNVDQWTAECEAKIAASEALLEKLQKLS